MVEFSLILPFLAVLLLGIVQFGVVFNHYLTLTDAVRAGARRGAVARFDPPAQRSAVIEAKVRQAAADLNTSKPGPLNVVVTEPATWETGADVKVRATYEYKLKILGLVVKSGNLESETTERVE
jgi:Flp pilus assembly protein TadG